MGKIITLPFAALFRWLYALTGSYGWSIILFGLVVKLVLLPFQMKSKRSMVRMGRLSGKQQELQKLYAKNQKKYQEELQKLYEEEGVNPASGCLWSFLPIFILIPLYSIVYRPITHFMGLSEEVLETLKTTAVQMGYNAEAYSVQYEQIGITDFIARNWEKFEGTVDGLINVNFSFLGMDLSQIPKSMFGDFSFRWECVGILLIPVVATVLQYISTILMNKSNGQPAPQGQTKTMMLMMPLMTLWFCYIMPAGMGVYWIINTVFSSIQEVLLGKFYMGKIQAEEEKRTVLRDADRKRRMEEARLRDAEIRENGERKEKKKQPAKTAEEKKASTNEAGRVGERPYARGRSYREDRYDDKE